MIARVFDLIGQSLLVVAVPSCVFWLAVGCQAPGPDRMYQSELADHYKQYEDYRPKEESETKSADDDEIASADVDTPQKTSETDSRVKHNRQQ